MSKSIFVLCLMISLLSVQCSSPAAEQDASAQQDAEPEPDSYAPFESASIRFEQNATDGDFEVVMELTGADEGLTRLKVVSPAGDLLVDFTSHGDESMGMRKFVMESPEPDDMESMEKGFPEGAYQFTGIDTEDNGFKGEATLSHQLPATASFLYPEAEAEDVPIEGMVVKWSPVEGISAYMVEVEAEEEGMNDSITATLPGSAQSFAVPDGFLQPGAEYKVAIGTVGAGGNRSFVEATFTTAGGMEGAGEAEEEDE